ncbi:MAG: type II secretion system F family protein [Campylobacteraceae bacterium]
MKKYFEVQIVTKGQKTKSVISADNKTDAIKIAKNKNPSSMVVKAIETSMPIDLKIKQITEEFTNSYIKQGIKTEFLIASFRQLSVMTNAGIPIHDSIKEVGKATVEKKLKSIFERIDEDLNAGMSLTNSASSFRNELGDVSIAMIELGENTGQMADSLKKLADILEEVNENKKKFKKAMRYPITVMIAIAVAFAILMIYVVPKFREIFASFNADLPLPTVLLLGAEKMINQYGLFLLGGIIILIFSTKYLYKHNKDYKAKADKYMLKTYLIGNVIFFSNMNRFTLILAELIKAGIPIVDALDTALLTVTNDEIRDKLSLVKISVQRGITLTDSFRETGLMEGMLIQMLQAGEQSGTVDTMLGKITEYYKSRFDELIDNLSAYIEPILLAFIAVMVLWLALGIFMPMWELGRAVKS